MQEKALEEALGWLWSTGLPKDVDEKARLLVLDTVGCVLAASRKPKLRKFAEVLAASDPGSATVPGFAQTFSSTAAAALFASAACADEACEGLARAHGRPGVPAIAACMGLVRGMLWQRMDELIPAVVAGYEIGGRMGEAIRMKPGMHVDASWPSLGTAVATARILGGTKEQALAAVRTAACQVPQSLYLPAKTGADARNTYLSHASHLGILAAQSAHAGYTAPEGALGKIGAGAFAPPGEWLVLQGYLKPYAAVRHVHYAAAAALALRPKLVGKLGAITRIELSTYAEALTYCANRAPKTPIQAQFSLSYGVACGLLTGDLSPASYEELENETLKKIESRITLRDWNSGERGATLKVYLGDSHVEASVDRVPGDPEQPMTRAEVLAKFERYAGAAGEGYLKAILK